MSKITILMTDDTTEISLDGEDIACANYDEHGYSGMELLEEVARGFARKLKFDLDVINNA